MKTAFRVILACLLAAPALTSCYEKAEIDYATYYTYRNESSSRVTLTSYFFGAGQEDSTFVLSVNGEHTLLFLMWGSYVPPFSWRDVPGGLDSLVIINDTRKVVQRTRNEDWFYELSGLYVSDNYELVSEGDYKIKYLYTFTDSFFDQGEPLSP